MRHFLIIPDYIAGALKWQSLSNSTQMHLEALVPSCPQFMVTLIISIVIIAFYCWKYEKMKVISLTPFIASYKHHIIPPVPNFRYFRSQNLILPQIYKSLVAIPSRLETFATNDGGRCFTICVPATAYSPLCLSSASKLSMHNRLSRSYAEIYVLLELRLP